MFANVVCRACTSPSLLSVASVKCCTSTVRSARRLTAIPWQRPRTDVYRVVAFAVTGSSLAYVGATIVDYERRRQELTKFYDTDLFGRSQKRGEFRQQANSLWQRLSPGQTTVVALIASNVLVCALWRVPALTVLMRKFFMNSFQASALYSPMLLSVWSHYTLWHLAANMYVLWSFGPAVHDMHFKSSEHFMAFYVSAGLLSSMTSLAHQAFTGNAIASLGASGAVIALLMYTCTKMPDIQLSIIFLPMFTFSAQSAVIGMLALDTAGLVLGWRMFDHAAHLGGALFGIWYAKYGEQALWGKRDRVQRYWRAVRE